jgi:hypothetical protein
MQSVTKLHDKDSFKSDHIAQPFFQQTFLRGKNTTGVTVIKKFLFQLLLQQKNCKGFWESLKLPNQD